MSDGRKDADDVETTASAEEAEVAETTDDAAGEPIDDAASDETALADEAADEPDQYDYEQAHAEDEHYEEHSEESHGWRKSPHASSKSARRVKPRVSR